MTVFVFGLGYAGSAIAAHGAANGLEINGTGGKSVCVFDDNDAVLANLQVCRVIMSTVPPGPEGDPVLNAYGAALAGKRLVYLSSTGVYGDTGGAWVDESAGITGRRAERNAADAAWLARGAVVLRLPGIYGPGRSALDRVARNEAHRVDLPGQVFSRIHVTDIARAALAAIDAPTGAYNIADDAPASQNAVIAYAAALLGLPAPAFVSLDSLSPQARAFYRENRRVANGKAKRLMGWAPLYPDFASGLRALSAMSSPANASTPPAPASNVQR